MPLRNLWKGAIHIVQSAAAAKFYAAVTDPTVRFGLLHMTDQVTPEQRMPDPKASRGPAAGSGRKAYH